MDAVMNEVERVVATTDVTTDPCTGRPVNRPRGHSNCCPSLTRMAPLPAAPRHAQATHAQATAEGRTNAAMHPSRGGRRMPGKDNIPSCHVFPLHTAPLPVLS